MSDEVEVTATEVAPKADETASPAKATERVEETPVSEGEQRPAKTFTQDEVDALLGKRLSQAERKWQREHQQARPTEQPRAEPVVEQPKQGKPAPESFQTTQDYLEALTDWKAEQKVTEKLDERERKQRATTAQGAEQRAIEAYEKRQDIARAKYDDFDEVATNPNLPITDAMAFEIRGSDIGEEIHYYLGTHLDEAKRIAKLHPLTQAKELGKLEAKLAAAQPEPVKLSNAPDPITPQRPKANAAPVYDTTDPRAIKSMTTSEWIAADRKRQEAKWKATHG